jgi:hypothetical protein
VLLNSTLKQLRQIQTTWYALKKTLNSGNLLGYHSALLISLIRKLERGELHFLTVYCINYIHAWHLNIGEMLSYGEKAA